MEKVKAIYTDGVNKVLELVGSVHEEGWHDLPGRRCGWQQQF
jgi:hypothetical protein